MELLSQQPLFSTEPETKGFDLSSGLKWIYPENYPIRKYQFSIVQTALFHNTLVCLPTGLGKTFIAAVVMYNFWRWYPSGIIIFLAPTKPLVAQQIDACHDIMGIPISQTIELTGATNQKLREIAWRNKRVIFATPQTFQKDLEKGIVQTELIKCVVIDEAHKALGKHSYCESIRILHETNRYHRLLALSATPGSKLDAVQDVIRNLHITHLELRDDTSPDIMPYINERKLDIIQVGLGNDLTRFHERYIEIMDPHFRVLLRSNIIRGATTNITKGRIFLLRKEFMSRQNKPYNYGSILKALTILLSMCHANDLLINHGLRAFVHFFENHSDKFWLKDEPNLTILLDEINEFIGSFPKIKSVMDCDAVDIPDNIVFGHEKFKKLRELLTAHFENAAEKKIDTRAIIFIEFRDIVNEVFVLLLQLRPLIRPQVFVGQAGLKQKQQKKALNDFRENHVNVLISTSVGEEGLDVGEVDLIICFDILQHSPTRLVQRMGRTGRKRDGHIIVLVTDGREYKTLKSALAKRDSLNNKVLHSSGIIDALGDDSPRMIPRDLNPECLMMRITSIPTTPRSRKQRNKIHSKATKNEVESDQKKIKKNVKIKPSDKTNSLKKNQNTMAKFLTLGPNHDNITQESEIVTMRIEKVHPIEFQLQSHGNNSVRVKPSDVKLLTSDNESIEFLTLCTLKQSTLDTTIEKKLLNISYMPEFPDEKSNSFLDYEIPSLSILNCIKMLGEYISPTEDEFIDVHNVDNDEVWKPDDCSHFSNNSRCPELILTSGRFEDLLNTSESDNTNFSADELFHDEEVDGGDNKKFNGNDFQHKNDVGTNERNLSKSIVVDGAFEDILDESSDESILEVTSQPTETLCDNPVDYPKSNSQNTKDIPIISLITPELADINSKINSNENILSQHPIENAEDKQNNIEEKNRISSIETDFNLNLDFESDLSSWGNSSLKASSVSTKILSTNPITSHDHTQNCTTNGNVIINANKSQQTQEIDSQTSNMNTQDRMSPDLSKSTFRLKIKLNESLKTVEPQSKIFEMTNNMDEKENSTDDDMFGVESLLLDSDFDDQDTAIENTNTTNKNNSEEAKAEQIKTVQKNNNKSVGDSNLHSAETNIAGDNDFIDEFDWNSDLETSLAPITNSKYFKSNNDTISNNSLRNQSPDILKNSHRFNRELNERKKNVNPKLVNIEEKYLSKVKSNFQPNSNSDDDFATEKIEKIVYRKLENRFSDNEIFSNNSSKLMAGRELGHTSNGHGSELLSKENFDKFVTSEKFMSKPKILLPIKSSSLEVEKFNSPDRFLKTKKSKKKRNRVKNNFIDDEADVTSDETHSLGSSEDDDENDDLEGFVSHSQYHDSTVDMKAHYLQSVRSPRQHGRFFIKKPRTPPPNVEIYSQAIPTDEPNSYLYDSFCVEGDEEMSEHSDHSPEEISILAEVERKLKIKKRKRRNSFGSSRPKRKRIVANNSDDSSEDETEKLRAEIADRSIMLKNGTLS